MSLNCALNTLMLDGLEVMQGFQLCVIKCVCLILQIDDNVKSCKGVDTSSTATSISI